MSFVVKAIDLVDKTALVDWGWVVHSHPLPQAIVDDPNLPLIRMRELIEELRPELPAELALSSQLRELIEQRVGSTPDALYVHYDDGDVHTQDQPLEF